MLFQFDKEKIDTESVAFADIKPGDTIVHYVENSYGVDYVWVGTTLEQSRLGNEWYGTGRRHVKRRTASHGGDGTWGRFLEDDRHDVLIVADWHGEETGHSIYRVK